MEAHADGNVILQRLHRRRKIGIVGGTCDGEMKLEIRILPVRLAIGRVPHEFERLADRSERGRRVAHGGRFSCRRLERQAKLIAIEKVRDILQLPEAKRLFHADRPDETAGTTP